MPEAHSWTRRPREIPPSGVLTMFKDKQDEAQTKIGSLFGYAMHKLNGNYDENGDLISGSGN